MVGVVVVVVEASVVVVVRTVVSIFVVVVVSVVVVNGYKKINILILNLFSKISLYEPYSGRRSYNFISFYN